MATLLRQRIKASRIYAGLSQEKLGELCGVSKSAVSMWETSNTKKATTPTLDNLKAICRATGAPIGWLVDDESEMTPAWMLIGY
jgi:transcriptional regulator with XRE-family HTH domain